MNFIDSCGSLLLFFSFHTGISLTAQKAQEYNKKARSAREKTLGWWVLTQSAIPTV